MSDENAPIEFFSSRCRRSPSHTRIWYSGGKTLCEQIHRFLQPSLLHLTFSFDRDLLSATLRSRNLSSTRCGCHETRVEAFVPRLWRSNVWLSRSRLAFGGKKIHPWYRRKRGLRNLRSADPPMDTRYRFGPSFGTSLQKARLEDILIEVLFFQTTQMIYRDILIGC